MIIKTLTNISGEIWAQDENRLLIKNIKIANKHNVQLLLEIKLIKNMRCYFMLIKAVKLTITHSYNVSVKQTLMLFVLLCAWKTCTRSLKK